MALINCPNCGNQISDKAINCPHCGVVLNTPITNTPVSITKPTPLGDPYPKSEGKGFTILLPFCAIGFLACVFANIFQESWIWRIYWISILGILWVLAFRCKNPIRNAAIPITALTSIAVIISFISGFLFVDGITDNMGFSEYILWFVTIPFFLCFLSFILLSIAHPGLLRVSLLILSAFLFVVVISNIYFLLESDSLFSFRLIDFVPCVGLLLMLIASIIQKE